MYKITFEKKCAKSISKLDKKIQTQILKYLTQEKLLENPKSFGKCLLYKKKGNWRYRVGDYRIVSKILDDEMVILVVDVGHRSKVYK